ncbi:NADP-dependent oxidoreductase domain-containing protein [Phakopsora pachyrhizi]|uniref:NADP-dependent oxidoreductase domain-containing protein n=1 Tax=Phakopsora pachyrhizi TaxID=170000 RepID=A0AAV0BV33_PHAPC|nr:NADP-dependent oxidoreductase domain-containing protein [Phakopsora pachyrhizi]CAH7689951.1 NADP-dependent oxidoreductase domain-containing protein [Phakopsora pachyrhizi]
MSFNTTTTSISTDTDVILNTGARMPVLGFGVYESKDAAKSVKLALEAGYRHIDSARFYKNEADVEKAVQESGLDRSSLFLTTKVLGKEHGYEKCQAAILDSIKPPKPNYWDLILLHDPTSGPNNRIEAYRALAEGLKRGHSKSIGVSNFGVTHLVELEEAKVGPIPAINQVNVKNILIKIDKMVLISSIKIRFLLMIWAFSFFFFNKVELHPWCQQKSIVEYCRSKGIVVQAYCPLVRGQFMDHPTLVEIAKRHKKSVAQVLIRWSLQHGFVPLPKSDSPNRIKENVEVFDFELDSQSMEQLDGLDKGDSGAISWNPTSVA